MYDKVKEMLIRHEGVMCTLYDDTSEPPIKTIGVGRNFND